LTRIPPFRDHYRHFAQSKGGLGLEDVEKYPEFLIYARAPMTLANSPSSFEAAFSGVFGE